MVKDYKEIIYNNYFSNQLSQGINIDKIDQYYKQHEAYFKKNYLPFMPADRDSVIIDVGCGIGAFLNFAHKQGYQNVLGIDLCDENIEICKSNGFKVEKADAYNFFSNLESTFDLIVLNDVIEHLDKQEIFNLLFIMKDALSIKQMGGTLIIKAPNIANPYVGPASLHIDFTHQLCFTESSLKQILLAIGFSKINIIGTDIYVKKNLVNLFARFFSRLICFELYFKSWLFGRKTIKIFSKNLLAVVRK